MRRYRSVVTWAVCLLLFGLANSSALARQSTDEGIAASSSGVLGVTDAQLTSAFWVNRLQHPDHLVLDGADIAAQNARLQQLDPSMHNLRALPPTLSRAQVEGWINALAQPSTRALFDAQGQLISPAIQQAIFDNRALGAIPARQPTRYGLIVRRAALRSFPTALRVFSERGDTDIDRFQETAEFPGTPVVIAHTSADGKWLFVMGPRYAAWTQKGNVAVGSAAQVFSYVDKTPYRVITGAVEHTVFTPEQPAVSQLSLDMGTRVPLTKVPAQQAINGQTSYTSYALQLPLRDAGGTLVLTSALLQKNADSASNYLPLTRANVIRQAFKFLGERYGWGDAYDGRDCSGFVSDVYRSMGVEMPRNTGQQATSPAFQHQLFSASDSHASRVAAVQSLQIGDLVYIPGHVMMVIGRIDGQPYVIHDVSQIRFHKTDGTIAQIKLNAVSVTPLLPLLFDDLSTYVDHMTSIVRMRR